MYQARQKLCVAVSISLGALENHQKIFKCCVVSVIQSIHADSSFLNHSNSFNDNCASMAEILND